MENRILKSWMSACAGRALFSVVLTVLGFGFLIVLVLAAALVPLPYQYDSYRPLIVGAGLVVFFILAIGGVLIWGISQIRGRAEQLDQAFTPLGLARRGYLTNGRQYHGQVNGRPVDVYFYRGPTLDIYLESASRTRFSVTLKSRSGVVLGKPALIRLDSGDKDLEKLDIYTLDETWGKDLLSQPGVKEAILRLAEPEGPFEIPQIIYAPEALMLRLHHVPLERITPIHVQSWMQDLAIIVRSAESLPPPEKTAESSRLEHNTRTNRKAITLPAIGITCGIIGIITLCFLAASVGLVLFINYQAGTRPANTPEVLSDSFFSGRAYLDSNQNGQLDEQDMPLEGAMFTARDARGASSGGLTDKNGQATAWWPGDSQYPVTLRMQPPKGSFYILVSPAEVVLTKDHPYLSGAFLFTLPPQATVSP